MRVKAVLLGGLLPSSSAFFSSSRSALLSQRAILQHLSMSSSSSASFQVPTMEQLSTDPFMKQVSHSEKLIPLLQKNSNVLEQQELIQRLEAQLSHSDGIRGFFVTYLTGMDDNTPADQSEIPQALVTAMEAADPTVLIPLACMNVVMPTGMISMHQDKELSQQSKKTADRGVRFLASIKNKPEVIKTCDAILAVATGNQGTVDDDSFQYWTEFFEKWGYQEEQRRDIAKAIRTVMEAK